MRYSYFSFTPAMNETQKNLTNEEILGPPNVDIISVGLASLGSMIAGLVGGLFILVFTYFFLGSIQTSYIFPYVLPMVALFAILITSALTLSLNRMLFPEKYRLGSTALAQISIFSIFVFILVTPLYIYVGASKPDLLIFVFTIHILLNFLGASLLVEILSNYRYILLSIYGSFIGFLIATFLSVYFFLNYSPSKTALYSLVGVIILVNLVITLFRSLFEFAYYRYYTTTGNDHLGDIFSKIELEEKELVAQAEKELGKFE